MRIYRTGIVRIPNGTTLRGYGIIVPRFLWKINPNEENSEKPDVFSQKSKNLRNPAAKGWKGRCPLLQ